SSRPPVAAASTRTETIPSSRCRAEACTSTPRMRSTGTTVRDRRSTPRSTTSRPSCTPYQVRSHSTSAPTSATTITAASTATSPPDRNPPLTPSTASSGSSAPQYCRSEDSVTTRVTSVRGSSRRWPGGGGASKPCVPVRSLTPARSRRLVPDLVRPQAEVVRHRRGQRRPQLLDAGRPGVRGGADPDRGEPEQLLQRPAGGVHGLDPADRHDPPGAGQPALQRVDRVLGDLPAVHPVAPQRFDHDRDQGERHQQPTQH